MDATPSNPPTTALTNTPPAAPAPVQVALPSSPATTALAVWSPPAQWVAVLLCLAALLFILHGYGYLPLGTRPTELQRSEALKYRIDLNRATRAELMQLPGIGPKRAGDIEVYRQANGPFRSVEQMLETGHIGPKTLQRLRTWTYVDETAIKDNPPDSPRLGQPIIRAQSPDEKTLPEKRTAPVAVWTGPPLNINTASAEDLQKLKRIGPKLAQRIIEERQLRPFTSVEDLQRVHGIGPKTVDQVRPFVTVGK
jgi:competence ComEA-like helix-hairpin-helix protein